MHPREFFAEVKRRNVYKVAVAYGVVGWLVIQVASTVLPTFHAAEWVLQTLVVVVALGFPVALVIAWAFEMTPEGLKRTESIQPNEVLPTWSKRKFVAVFAILALIASGLMVWQFVRTKLQPANDGAADASRISDKSIAVLPFESLSEDKQNAFFADGVQDEILTDLAKVADLKVISRTSVMQYKNAAARNLREIGQQLGVAKLLEGSVQRAANRVRVNAQLIDARTDAHLWAQTYDRDLADVFAIQSEIAEAIAGQLQARLSPAEHAAMMQPPTTDLIANDLYLRAKALDELANDPGAKEGLLNAVSLLEEAVRRDPQFVVAWCLLSEVHLDLYWGGFDHTSARREQAHLALQRAEQIRPDDGDVHLQKGAYAYHGFRDYEHALPEFELARQRLPNSSHLYIYLASVDRRQARWEDSLHNFDRAIELDPRNSFPCEEAAFTRVGLRRYNEARQLLERALSLNPNDTFARELAWQLPYLEAADTVQWRSHLNAVLAEGKEAASHVSSMFVDCSLAERDRKAAAQGLDLIPAEGAVNPISDSLWPRDWYVGLVARSFGDTAAAQAAFTSARAEATKLLHDQPDYEATWSILAAVDAGLGRKTEAIAEAKRACELLPISKDAWDGPSYIANLALVYTWVGEKDLALEQLAASAKLPGGISYGALKLSPMWDALRDDPRFGEIVASLAPKDTPR